MELTQRFIDSDIPPVSFIGVPEHTYADPESQPAQFIPRDSCALVEHEIKTASGIPLRVYVQPSNAKNAIVTYHDIGTNHLSFTGFFSYPEMRVITRHFTVYHVCAPGHHEGADAVAARPAQYPNLDQLAEMLTSVVEHFKIPCFVGFGMGAGSNVLARFALHHPDSVLALFLINPNGTTHGYYEWFRNRWSDLPQLQRGIITDNLLDQLEAHWFGFGLANNDDLLGFYGQLLRTLNLTNVAGYIDAYINRTDLGLVRCLDLPSIVEQREKQAGTNAGPPTAIKVSCCLVTGARAQELARALSDLNGRMDPRKTQFLIVPDCTGFLMEENPDKLALNFLHFLRTEGLVINLTPEKLLKDAVALQTASAALQGPTSEYAIEKN
uniref:Protein NDRG3 n=1 Tax=Schistocephalus solidus TaxID=70667 RepID=A0A0X3P1F8_SCHSO